MKELDDLELAFEDGRLSAFALLDMAIACPFDKKQPTYREAWLNGFAIGRVESEMAMLPSDQRSSPARVEIRKGLGRNAAR